MSTGKTIALIEALGGGTAAPTPPDMTNVVEIGKDMGDTNQSVVFVTDANGVTTTRARVPILINATGKPSGSYLTPPEIVYAENLSATSLPEEAFGDFNWSEDGSLVSLATVCFPRVKEIGHMCFTGCRSLQYINMPSLTTAGQSAFSGCYSLKDASLPNLQEIPDLFFYCCYNLMDVYAPAATTVGKQSFFNCTSLRTLYLPLVTTFGSGALVWCNNIEKIVCSATSLDNSINASVKLKTLVLDGGEVCTLNTNLNNNCPIAQGTGYIYVREALIESYKIAPYWSIYSTKFRTIEGNPWVMDEAYDY